MTLCLNHVCCDETSRLACTHARCTANHHPPTNPSLLCWVCCHTLLRGSGVQCHDCTAPHVREELRQCGTHALRGLARPHLGLERRSLLERGLSGPFPSSIS
jgi:hypothetical protein